MNALDFHMVCRICLVKKESYFLVPYTIQIDGMKILELVESCSGILIDQTESPALPKKVCHECIEQLKIAKEIKTKIIESRKILKKFVGKNAENEETHQNPVFVDVIKQEEIKVEEPVVRISVKTEDPDEDPAQDFYSFFNDSYNYDSGDSDASQPIPTKISKITKTKQPKLQIPRLNPISFENPDEKNFICDFCGEIFPHRTNLQNHFRKFHKRNKIHQCRTCKQTFRWGNGLKVHLKYHENQKDFACHLCPRRYVLKTELRKHIQTHNCEDLEICGGCAKAFNSHYMKKHKPNCKGNASKEEIQRAINDLEIEYNCDKCGLKICGKIFLTKHMQRTHLVPENESYTCKNCEKIFKNRFDLASHVRQVHKTQKTFDCEFCGRKFVKNKMLEIHQNSRSCVLNHFQCEMCQKKFKTKQGFENHFKSCNGENSSKELKKPKETKEWICEFCGKHLTSQPGHRRHLISQHRDVMNAKLPPKLSCPHCPKIFYYKHDLQTHVNSKHLKLQAFKCELCPKGYAIATGLRRHMRRIHNKTEEEKEDEKIFGCSFCPAKYEKEKALANHLLHHDLSSPDRPFHCLICTRSFKVKKILNLHMRTKHSETN